ncbi:FeoA family protein [Hazenella coriacea]|uniref:Ferrous iron transport protein A n=1 Tax=Hazenella coriacea TaxID=1179467 RepID=A0A4R3L760_9BACL|nr:FeoA family protein [Hazenella coriacea]TCS95761.1 ferrous iron transport protein A [Hazenella coriacea]
MKLFELKKGHQAQIVDTSQLNPFIRRRLLDLGVTSGTLIRITQILPFGGAFTFEVNGQGIGIRRHEAKQIEVQII